MSDEARRLLERAKPIIAWGGNRELAGEIAAFLAQPEPAAREAALVGAATKALEWISAVEVAKMPGAGDTQSEVHRELEAVLADTSPAALLAQGERLQEEESDLRVVAAHLELLNEPGVSDYLVDALVIMRRVLAARAALAPGEETAT